jgi:hypothetical protein
MSCIMEWSELQSALSIKRLRGDEYGGHIEIYWAHKKFVGSSFRKCICCTNTLYWLKMYNALFYCYLRSDTCIHTYIQTNIFIYLFIYIFKKQSFVR